MGIAFDFNTLRSVMTVVSVVVFVGLVMWSYSARRKDDYEQASRLPLDDD